MSNARNLANLLGTGTTISTSKLGLTFSNGSATQDGTSNNTVYDMVTGLTIPSKALIVIGYDFNPKSGQNGVPGSNATCWVLITDSSNSAIDSSTASNMVNANPVVGYRNVIGQVTYFNETGSDLTSHKIRAQQYADGTLNSSVITIKYKIIGFG